MQQLYIHFYSKADLPNQINANLHINFVSLYAAHNLLKFDSVQNCSVDYPTDFDVEQQNYFNYNLTFHSMKLHSALTKTAAQDLNKILNLDVLQALARRLTSQKQADMSMQQKLNNESMEAQTPSTVDTSLRRRGSAITKSMRPESRSRGKAILNRKPSITNQIAVTRGNTLNLSENQSEITTQAQVQNSNVERKVLMDRAVYYGNVELPYLHSSDAISCLYERPKANDKTCQQPLINPPPGISAHLLTNVKNLYLYYTPLDTLRQLGTGWSNLKSLTVMCSSSLVDLSGLSIFPSLEYLFVPHNNIQQISDLMYHSTLRCVDLQDNKIALIDQIQYIYTITNLEWVDVSHNPITLIKEKSRIISQNLGAKLQMEDHNKLHEYELQQMGLDAEAYSYENIQSCNNLIREINDQIIKQEIKIGQAWRRISENSKNANIQPPTEHDIQIIATYDEQSSDAQDMESSRVKQENIKLRVTPLIDYAPSIINTDPLKKFFLNKVCPQSRQQKQKQQNGQEQSRGLNKQPRVKKLAATQNFVPAVSEQKPRLSSVSVKKRLGKLSVSKVGVLTSTCSAALTNLKTKQQFSDVGCVTSPSGLKFLSKRKLFHKASQQISRS